MMSRGLTRLSGVLAAIGALALASTSAFSASAEKEAQIASDHAGFAASSTTLDEAKSHLHHTVNCLVGPDGEMFDSAELNPCKGMGKGAIPDATDAKMKATLESALGAAVDGLSADELDVAQNNARKVAGLLKDVQ